MQINVLRTKISFQFWRENFNIQMWTDTNPIWWTYNDIFISIALHYNRITLNGNVGTFNLKKSKIRSCACPVTHKGTNSKVSFLSLRQFCIQNYSLL